jgi:hypothetical protein
MKPLAFILALSIAANAALAFLFVHSNSGHAQTPAFFGSSTNSNRKSDGTPNSSNSEAGVLGLDAKTWSNLQAGDLKTLAERLRAAGFPPAVVRAVVAALVDEKYAAQRKALLAKQDETPFWQRSSYGYDSKLMASLRDLNKQERDETKSLLGPDGLAGSNDERQAWQRRQYGDLPAEKLEQMQAILSDYGDLRSDIYSKANGVMLPEDREKIALLEKEQRADLSALLAPEELENYELRSSNTAHLIRSQLSIFKASEAEFRALFKATRAAEDQYGSLTNGPSNPDQVTKMRDSVLASLQTQLSPERYAELQQATDPKYQMTNRLVARLELPASAAVETVAIQTDVQKRAQTIRRDTTLSPEQRTAQLTELTQEATSKLSTTLTPRGLEAYKQYGGFWLQNLNPPPGRTTTRISQ